MTVNPNKVYLVTQDLSKLQGTEMENKETVLDNNVYKVLDYRVSSYRQRNRKGVPYNNTKLGRVWVTVDATEHESNEFFYAALHSKTPVSFTLIFANRTDGTVPFMKYDNSFVVDCYVVNIEEEFVSKTGEKEPLQQLHIEFLGADSRRLNDKNSWE